MTPPSAVGAVSGCREAHIAPPCIRYSGVTRYYSHGSPAHASNPQGIWRKICARGKSGTLAGCGGRRPGACAPAARTPVQERARRTAPSSHPIGPHPLEVVHGIADAPLELLRMVRGFERAQGDAGHDLLRLDVVHIAEYSTLRKHPDERLSRTCAERRSSRKKPTLAGPRLTHARSLRPCRTPPRRRARNRPAPGASARRAWRKYCACGPG